MNMKKQNIYPLLQAALLLLLASCTQEEFPTVHLQDKAQQLTISVTDGGYAPADGKTTRAVENGYTTEFTEGDACGLYVVRGTQTLYSNVKLTAEKDAATGDLVWKSENTTPLMGGLSDEHYYLYYPYQADMSGKTATLTGSALTDTEFFAPLVSAWQPQDDQSTHAAYTASDLMTAEGIATPDANNTLNLSFPMTHQMALVVIEMPKTVYKFTSTNYPDYTTDTEAEFTGAVQPLRVTNDTYRYLVNSQATSSPTIEGSYDDGSKEFTVSPSNLAAGHYKKYKVNGLTELTKSYAIQPGDFLLANGNLVPKEISLTEEQKASVTAIVFYVGHHENDASDYSATRIGQKKCHGYAVALQDATTTNIYCMWGVYDKELGLYISGTNNVGNPDIDWNGYSNTQKIVNAAGGEQNLNKDTEAGYPATWYAVVYYESKTPAPPKSSGWFLPSIGQMQRVHKQGNLLEETSVYNSLDGRYWSSSELYYSPHRSVVHVDLSKYYLDVSYKNKEECYVRPILAF